MTLLGLIGSGELIVILAITLIVFLPPLIALIDILRNDFEANNKIIWVLVVIFLNLLGALLYFFIGRNQKIRTNNQR
ncbi:PLD nuclease N-terminal domain-containing protein [Mangrovibacterium sp.]|uniref:PLD nuclease N-terminal domain-containing protein n=1 Tax=Mangrovibacterium sp. TaxID=1961364 RepID=UPI003569001E